MNDAAKNGPPDDALFRRTRTIVPRFGQLRVTKYMRNNRNFYLSIRSLFHPHYFFEFSLIFFSFIILLLFNKTKYVPLENALRITYISPIRGITLFISIIKEVKK